MITLLVVTSCASLAVEEAGTPPPLPQRTTVRAADGTPIAHLYDENRVVLAPEDIPPVVTQALVAAEDDAFFEHNGVDGSAVLRALAKTLDGSPQGGSTITQQLAKMRYDQDGSRSVGDKVREAAIALHLEETHSKREILTAYLNTAYFGAGAYGIAAAADEYFRKTVDRLTLAEAALLVGLVRAPSELDPRRNPDGAQRRRAYVLRRMQEEGSIDAARAARANRAPLKIQPARARLNRAPAFVGWIERALLADPALGATREERAAKLRRGGLDITTTLDLRMQRAAERAVTRILGRDDDPQVALVAVEPGTGAVRAMVGGRDLRPGDLNLAVDARRHPGSTFKPFVLAAAVERGIGPDARYDASQTTLRWDEGRARWRIRNFDGRDHGPMTLHDAMIGSVNGVYARLAIDVGPGAVIDVARRAGISSEMDPYPSIALGALPRGTSPLEMAAAYATLASYGRYAQPTGLAAVDDHDGNPLHRLDPSPLPAIDPGVAHVVVEALEDVMRSGTGRSAAFGRPAIGKTGTTEEHADAWFVGGTPDLITAVWVGYPDAREPMRNVRGIRVTGSSFPAAIWRSFMRAATRDAEARPFEPPPHALITVRVGRDGACLAGPDGEERSLPPTLIPPVPCPPDPTPTPSTSPTPTTSPSPASTQMAAADVDGRGTERER